jgi:diamine N-acetyltransferase
MSHSDGKMTDGGIITRPAVLTDYAGLCSLWEFLDEYHREALPHRFRAPAGVRRELNYVRSLIDGPDSTIFVAESSQKELLGLVTTFARIQAEMPIRAERRYVDVDNLVVSPSGRRGGVGRMLMEASAQWGRQRGIKNIEVNVHDFNLAAISFYRSLGYEMSSHRMRLPDDTSN